jgi:O-antigen/teichoic acid export membrane protein
MAFLGYGVWSLVAYRLVQITISTLLYWFNTKWKPTGKFSKSKFNKHFHFGYKLTLSGLLDTVFTNLYSIIIGRYFPVAQVGFYQRANSLKMLPVSTISSVVGRVSYPLFAQIKDDNQRLKRVYKKIMQMIIFLLAPTLIILGVLAEPLFRFLFTEKWLPAVPYFQILVITGILYPIHAYNLNIINVKGRSDLFLKLEIIKKAMIVVVVGIAFRYGIYGLLYSSVITSILAFFINTHYSGKFIAYTAWEQIKDIMPILLLATFVGALVFFADASITNLWQTAYLNNTFPLEIIHNYLSFDFFRLLTGGLFGSIVYILLSYLLKSHSLQEIFVILQQRKKNG